MEFIDLYKNCFILILYDKDSYVIKEHVIVRYEFGVNVSVFPLFDTFLCDGGWELSYLYTQR